MNNKILYLATTPHEIRVAIVYEFVLTIGRLSLFSGYPGPTVMNMLGATRDRP